MWFGVLAAMELLKARRCGLHKPVLAGGESPSSAVVRSTLIVLTSQHTLPPHAYIDFGKGQERIDAAFRTIQTDSS